MIASLAEINRIPFDLPEDEGTLSSGFHTEYSGMRFSFFALTEYAAMVSVSALAVIFFLGGWQPPLDPAMFGLHLPDFIMSFSGIGWFIGKSVFLVYFFMWLRFTIPRYRYDQLMTIGWKILIPISLVTLIVTGFMRI